MTRAQEWLELFKVGLPAMLLVVCTIGTVATGFQNNWMASAGWGMSTILCVAVIYIRDQHSYCDYHNGEK